MDYNQKHQCNFERVLGAIGGIAKGKAAKTCALVLTGSAWLGSGALAQEDEVPTNQDLWERIELLEFELESLRETQSTNNSSGQSTQNDWQLRNQVGGVAPSGIIGVLGQTTRFSSTFNPAVGAALDVLPNYSTRRDTIGDGADRFYLRAAELNMSAQFDPFGYAFVTLEATAGAETEVEFIEGAAILNRLPANFSLKGGKFLGDFGRFGQRHEHEMPFVEKTRDLLRLISGAASIRLALKSINGLGLATTHRFAGRSASTMI